MKKDFIRDDGKVRKCDFNISKMNIFEHMYFNVFCWGYFKDIFTYVLESLKESLVNLFYLIFNLTVLIFTPITLVLCAIIQIKNAKEICNKNKRD